MISFEWSRHWISFTDSQKLELHTKYIVRPCESITEEVSFEWSHHKISSKDPKIRAAYKI